MSSFASCSLTGVVQVISQAVVVLGSKSIAEMVG